MWRNQFAGANNVSGRIELSFLVKDVNGCIVYNSTPQDMKELDS